MFSKGTQNLIERWKAKKALIDRGVNFNTRYTTYHYNLVTEEAKNIDFKIDTKEEIIAHLDDEDTVRLE